MTKKTLCVLLIAVFLMLIGAVLFLFPFFTQSTDTTSTIYEIHSPLQQIEIDFNKPISPFVRTKKPILKLSAIEKMNIMFPKKMENLCSLTALKNHRFCSN